MNQTQDLRSDIIAGLIPFRPQEVTNREPHEKANRADLWWELIDEVMYLAVSDQARGLPGYKGNS